MGSTFPKGISQKVNIIAQLEFRLGYYDGTVQHIIHSAMGTPFLYYFLFINVDGY